ncbi:MAG: glycosyltransferase, partial [Terriglobia bacterium]
CASEKQRDFWIGMLSSLNRINPATYDRDKTLRGLISVVPFGVPDTEPRHTRKSLKGEFGTIKDADKVILWGGGIYNWFDPVTLIKAMQRISSERNDVKLFFMGLEHPNPDVPEMKMSSDAIQLSKDLNLYDRQVFFNFGWVSYEERQNYLLEADIGISTHLEHAETDFSFRTRLLDYIWAGLPIVTTGGDSMSDLIRQQNLGRTVLPEDVDGLTGTLLDLLDDAEEMKRISENLSNVAGEFRWEKVTEPLDRFCQDPIVAPDKAPPQAVALADEKERVYVLDGESKSVAYYMKRSFLHFRNGGVKKVVFHGRDFLRRLRASS